MRYRIIIFVILFPILTLGQLPHFEQLDILKNVRNYDVNFTYQDNAGFIWFGTSEGLVLFDGIAYKIFTVKDSLYSNEITALIEDTTGTFWIGHASGEISKGTPGDFEKWMPEEGLPKQTITTFYIDNQNNIWFGTAGEGVYYFDQNRQRVYNLNTDDGLSDNFIYKIKQDWRNRFWISTDYGLNIYDKQNKNFRLVSMKDGLPDNIVKDFYFMDTSNVLIGMEDNGLTILNISNTTFSKLFDWEFGSLNNLIVHKNEIWVSTKRKGIVQLQKSNNKYNARQFTSNEGLISNRTSHISIDRENNIWITSKKGVVLSPSSILSLLDKNDGLNLENIYNFIIDKNNNYWIGTEQGVYILSKDKKGSKTLEKLNISNQINDKAIVAIYEDIKGNIWLGTYGYGVFRVLHDMSAVENFTIENGLGNNNIISITGNGNIVVFSTLGGGASIFDYNKPENFYTLDMSNGLPSNYVYYSFIDSQNRIWFAMDGGLAYLDKNKIYIIEKLKEFNISEIYGITEDVKKNIWVTTASQGVIKIANDSLQFFTIDNGLHSNAFASIFFDGKEKVLLVHESGIDLININNNAIAFYGKEFGFYDINPVLNAIYQDENKNIWIAGKHSVLKYNTIKSYAQDSKPILLFTSKKVYFDHIPKDKTVFNYKQNHFTFDYIGLWYKAPERILYRHKLTNYDIDWSQPNTLRSTTYSNLASGEYTFQVQVTNESGEWIASDDAIFSFKIRPPFWQTWWFISISVISLILLVYFIIVYRTRALEKEKDKLEEEVRKRTAKIQHQKEEIEAQRDEIEKKNEDIMDSIQYASRIQTAVIPPLNDLTSVFKDAFVLNKPRDIVSGDFYWFARRDNLIFLAAADCTGHGVPGAFMSMLGIASLNEIVNSADCQCDASFVLNRLRDKIKTSLRQEGKIGEAKDGMDIAFCIIDLQNKELNYAGAYNPLWLIRDNELIPFKADKMPIGVHLNDSKDFNNTKIELKKNDRFYLFSDGYQDQFGGDNGRKFLTKNFKNLLLDIHQKDFNTQKEILDDTIINWIGTRQQIDDILVIGFKI